MATRCTPFGLFAGITTGSFVEKTNIQLSGTDLYRNHTRLDMNYLCALAQDLSKKPEIKNKIKFFPNSSIYAVGSELRYVEYKYKNSRRFHNLIAVENTDYLQKIIENGKAGALLCDLCNLLVDNDITLDEANGFIDELVESQFLVSEFDPSVTGEELLCQILAVLNRIGQSNYDLRQITHTLNDINNKLNEISNTCIGRPDSIYESITSRIKTLETRFEPNYLFQADMVKPANHCLLNEKTAFEVYSAMEVLNKLRPPSTRNNLDQFREAFYERYEDEEVPLLQALDTETGVGYLQNTPRGLTPLVDGLIIPGKQSHMDNIKWNDVLSFLNRKYAEALRDNKYSIEISDNDLKHFKANWNDLPETISALIKIIKHFPDENSEIHISFIGGTCAANLIGRFCHADKKVEELTRKIIDQDEAQNNQIIFAEIVHLPESRTGNILLRPVLRKYEIPYLAKSGVSYDYQLRLDDLFVSVKGNQIFLRSKRLNKQIIPRLTSAHGYSFNSLPVYHFLCDLQSQNIRRSLEFSWGPLSEIQRFLPRVVYKNIILSRASWHFFKTDIDQMNKIKEPEKRISLFKSMAKSYQVPDEIILADSDNELYLNLNNMICVNILLDQVKMRNSFTLKEFLFSEDDLIVRGPEGGFTNEFLISYYKNKDFMNKIT